MGTLLWWRCQSPVAHSCGLLNNSNSFCGGMFKLNAQFLADLLLYLVSHFECDGHTAHMLIQHIYCPHWPVQWRCPCSHMCIPVHSPRLPGYMGVRRTILVTLTMAGIFPDRPHKYNTQMLDNIRIQRLIHKGYISLTQNKPTTNKMLHQELVLKDLLAEWNKVSFPLT